MSDTKYYVWGEFGYEALLWTDAGWAASGEDARLVVFDTKEEAEQCAAAVIHQDGGHPANRRKPIATDVNEADDGVWTGDTVNMKDLAQAWPEA